MSQMTLHTLVGTALIDPEFCHDLLNGRRHALLAEFDLTDEEREVVMLVEADSIQQFAAQLCEWLKAQDGCTSYPPVAASVSYSPLRSPVGPGLRRGKPPYF
jgi:hypothetical protein